jgi:uncharacterized protein YuzB (UPF0349 family)
MWNHLAESLNKQKGNSVEMIQDIGSTNTCMDVRIGLCKGNMEEGGTGEEVVEEEMKFLDHLQDTHYMIIKQVKKLEKN